MTESGKRAGRPPTVEGKGHLVRIAPSVVEQARRVAAWTGSTLGEVISDICRGPLEAKYREMLRREHAEQFGPSAPVASAPTEDPAEVPANGRRKSARGPKKR